MVSTAVAATAFFQLYINGANTLQWIQVSGTLTAYSVVAGIATSRYSAAWNATTYRYLRIRESAGTIFWDSSTDGVSWTNRGSVANPFAITDLFIDFGATCGNIASPGSFRLDDVNLLLPALTTAWNWTQIVWPFDERTETITAAIDVVGTVAGCIVASDGVDASDNPSGNVRYFSGPMDAGRVLTEQPTLAAAQAMAVYFPLDGRLDLESMVEGHCYRIYHRSVDGNPYTIRELYPRRTIYADDIKAESILAIHIGVIDLDAQHNITAASGGVQLNDQGVTVVAPQNTPLDMNAYKFIKSDGTMLGGTYAYYSPGVPSHYIVGKSVSVAGEDSHFDIQAIAPIGKVAEIFLLAQRAGSADVTIDILNTTTRQVAIDADFTFINGALGIRTAAVAATPLVIKGTGTTNTTTAFQVINNSSLNNFKVDDIGRVYTRAGIPWDMGNYVAGGTLTATGLIAVNVNGTQRFILAR